MCSVSMPSAWPGAGESSKQSVAIQNDRAGMAMSLAVNQKQPVGTSLPQPSGRRPASVSDLSGKCFDDGGTNGEMQDEKRQQKADACRGPAGDHCRAGQNVPLLLARCADV